MKKKLNVGLLIAILVLILGLGLAGYTLVKYVWMPNGILSETNTDMVDTTPEPTRSVEFSKVKFSGETYKLLDYSVQGNMIDVYYLEYTNILIKATDVIPTPTPSPKPTSKPYKPRDSWDYWNEYNPEPTPCYGVYDNHSKNEVIDMLNGEGVKLTTYSFDNLCEEYELELNKSRQKADSVTIETNLEELRYDIGHDVSGRCSVTYTPVIGHILIENSNVILTN